MIRNAYAKRSKWRVVHPTSPATWSRPRLQLRPAECRHILLPQVKIGHRPTARDNAITLLSMMRLSLFRRRQVWLPTLWGWVVLLAVAGTACVFVLRNIYAFLAPNDPAPQARTLVVEGWLDGEELDQAVAAFRTGRYERVVTTGGPIEKSLVFPGSMNYADVAASYLKTHGLADTDVTPVTALPSGQDRTYHMAAAVRDWAARRGLALNVFDVFSAGTHARRSRMLYQMAFGPNVEVGVLSARPEDYDDQHWWRTSAGAKSVLEETIGLLWTTCCFYPGPPGSYEEMWGGPRTTDNVK